MSPSKTDGASFDTGIEEVPVTTQRTPFMQKDGDERLRHTGTARANLAATVEEPNGTQQEDWAKKHKHQTVLQQHCDFFDSDSDGIIWPLDTYRGFHRLGYNPLLCILAVLIIHANFSYPTLPGYLPDPLFRIHTANIHKDKHGSDSGTYDTEGRFIPQKFEDIFAKYAGGDKQGITAAEIRRYLKGQRLIADPIGWGGAIFECELKE
ncbi:putative peroxygenase [Lachnellula suecica]|uniref:Putative peroxygenase n=1 Tax=Lachnellula suecica TaxID=602035 RepID=A0A8T9C0T4_9HELO|nr:putative peroxygenase [Lachnellula suecica]